MTFAARDRTARRTDEPWTVGRGAVRTRLRRVALVRLPLTVLTAAILGAFVDTRHGYLLAFAGIGGLSMTSTVVISGIVATRVHPAERSIWRARFVACLMSFSAPVEVTLKISSSAILPPSAT